MLVCSNSFGGGIAESIKTFIKDKRFYAMFLIFLLCLCLSFIIYPDKDIFLYEGLIKNLPLYKRILFTIFILPSDSLFTNLLKDYSLYNIVNSSSLIFMFGCICGILVNLMFFMMFKSYKKLLFYIPYIMILIVFFNVYLNNHHLGVLTIFYIFLLWCTFSCSDTNTQHKTIYGKLLILFAAVVIGVQIYWSFSACFNEIRFPYSVSRDMAEFIKENKFQNYKIMERWWENGVYYRNINTGEKIYGEPVIPPSKYEYFIKNYEKIKNINFNQQHIAAVINPYFNKNIVYTYNINSPDRQYTLFKKMTKNEADEIKYKIKNKGIPDIILDKAQLEDIFEPDELKLLNYLLLKEFDFYKIWKDNYTIYSNELYIRKDLYENAEKPKK